MNSHEIAVLNCNVKNYLNTILDRTLTMHCKIRKNLPLTRKLETKVAIMLAHFILERMLEIPSWQPYIRLRKQCLKSDYEARHIV